MHYANKTARKAILVVGESHIPVVVDAREIIDLRDRRWHYEGRLWSNEMPISAFAVVMEHPLSLVFPNGETKVVQVFSQNPTQTNQASNPGLFEFFEAYFIAKNNVGKN